MIKGILSILTVCLFITSNIQLSHGTHFCGGHAVKTNVSLGHGHMDCGMSDMDQACEQKKIPSGNYFMQKECCQNVFTSLQIEDEYQRIVKASVELFPSLSLLQTPIKIMSGMEFEYDLTYIKPPPLRVEGDILTLLQTFLI